MSNQNSKTILISAVGNTDPFHKENDLFYGPLLTVLLRYAPSELWIILTKEILESSRFSALQKEIKFYSPDLVIKTLGNKAFEGEAINSKGLFDFYKPVLMTEITNLKDYHFIFNTGSGTPQIKNLLRLLAKTLLMNSNYKIVRTEKERENIQSGWVNYQINHLVREKDRHFAKRINEINEIESDINFYTFISSLDVLIDQYEYFAAKELAFKLNEKFNINSGDEFHALINTFEMLHYLLELDIEASALIFNSGPSIIFGEPVVDLLKEQLFLEKGRKKKRINLALKVCEIEIKKNNYTNVLKYISILRELMLLDVVENIINKDKRLYASLNRDEVERNNREMLEYLDKEFGGIGSYRSDGMLSNAIAEKVLIYAFNKGLNFIEDFKIFISEQSTNLVKRRNSISHNFVKATKDDYLLAVGLYKELYDVGIKYQFTNPEFPDVFNLYNKQLKQCIRTL